MKPQLDLTFQVVVAKLTIDDLDMNEKVLIDLKSQWLIRRKDQSSNFISISRLSFAFQRWQDTFVEWNETPTNICRALVTSAMPSTSERKKKVFLVAKETNVV